MKRILALVLCFAMLFALSGCAGKKNPDAEKPAELTAVQQMLANRKIVDGEYALYTSPDKIKNDFKYGEEHEDADDAHGSESNIYVEDLGNTTRITAATTQYYYDNGEEDDGITSIVSFDSVYGLDCGLATVDDVKVTFRDTEFSERALTSKQIYFIPFELENCKALSAQLDNIRIDFVFVDNVLVGINLLDTEKWSKS